MVIRFFNFLINNLFSFSFISLVPYGPLQGVLQYISPRHGIKKILGLYEPLVCTALTKLIQPKDICVDVGCHVGYLSLLMRKLCGSTGYVYSFDPIVSNCQHLRESICLNRYKNMACLNYALGDSVQTKSAHVFSDSGMANFLDSGFCNYTDVHPESFEITTLDKILSCKTVSFIKIDTEGYELNVLRGSVDILKKYRPSLLLEIHLKEQFPKIQELLKKYGYKLYTLDFQRLPRINSQPAIFHVIALQK